MSTTENTPAETVDAEPVGALEVMDPASGEVLNLAELDTVTLGRAVQRVDRHIVAVADFRKALILEAARRLDGLAQRKARVGPYELETNAPTTVEYREDVLRRNIEALVEAGKLEAAILGKLWPTPAPAPPPKPKLDKRVVNKLKADPDVAPAIAEASVRIANSRTLKVRELDHDA